jgi:diaminohydroxyphosphoribosylaminopyrimidine deaminase/5-amino-6-(5-phosphoribosylamino)uracil reductase
MQAAATELNIGFFSRMTRGIPWVRSKIAASLDGRTALANGVSKWITGEAARRDVHALRAQSCAILTGAGTVVADDPELTVRHVEGRDPMRVVLGTAGPEAKVQPALELSGPLVDVLGELASMGVLSVLVEGGATVAKRFHVEGLVDRYVLYLAPALLGGEDGRPLFSGPGASTIADAWRGRIVDVGRLGPDLRVELAPVTAETAERRVA